MRYSACCTSVLLLTLLAVTGCSVNPVTGKSQFTLMSEQEEIAIGEQNYQPSLQAQGGTYAVDPGVTRYVQQVGQKLAAVSHNTGLPFEFAVLDNDVPNAWALPGGKIAVNRGLLVVLEDEAQLAAVLGHEIVHATARHSANQMTQDALLGTSAQVLGAALGDTGYGALVTQGAGLSVAAWSARYGRDNELQADEVGMAYMSDVGYDPQAAVELQQTFVRLSEGQQQDFFSSFFASHPPSQDRVRANQERAGRLPGNTRNKAAFDRAMAQLKRDTPAYQAHAQARAALQNNEVDRALQLTEQAIAAQPRENHFWETKAHIMVLKEDHQAALAAYDKAVEANPNYFSSRLGRGTLRQAAGDLDGAEQDLKLSKQLLDTPNANYFLGQVMLAKGDKNQAVSYFQIAAQAGGEIGQAAQQQLDALAGQ